MLDDRFRSIRRHSTSRGLGVGFSNSVRHFFSFILTRSYNTSPVQKFVSSPPRRPSNTKTRTLSIRSFTRPAYASKITHIMTQTIHLGCRTSARYSLCSPNMASRPSSHCIWTSGCATPVGPAHPYGRLGRKALTSAYSCRHDLRPPSGVIPRWSRRNSWCNIAK